MKRLTVLICLLIMIFTSCVFAEDYQVVIPKQHVQALYDYYVDSFSIPGAFYLYRQVIGGGTVVVNGVRISKDSKKSDVYISPEIYVPIGIGQGSIYLGVMAIWHLGNTGNFIMGRENIGDSWADMGYRYYMSYLDDRIYELVETGVTVIKRHTAGTPTIKIKIE